MLLLAGPGATPGPTSAPAAAPAGPRPFQPGVEIDWRGAAVRVAARVVLREGPLEFLAAFHSKDHESILRMEAQPEHVYAALGLIGLSPGRPPTPRDDGASFEPASGDLVDLAVEWEACGAFQTADANAWLLRAATRRPPPPRAFVFGGSRRAADGTLTCRQTGEGAALADFADSLLSYPRSASSRSGALWCEARAEVVPPVGTRVTLVLRPATPRRYAMRLDAAGRLHVDGELVDVDDGASLIRLGAQLEPGRAQTIAVEGTLHSDERRTRAALLAAGAPPSAVRFERTAAATADRASDAAGEAGSGRD